MFDGLRATSQGHYGPILSEFLPSGPKRILIDSDGTAISFERAEAEHDITYEKVAVILVRADGWSLGAPDDLAQDAYRLWEGEWKWFGVQPCPFGFPIRRWPEWQRIRCRSLALTWEDLDPLVCMGCEGEDHPHGVLYLHGRCHPDAPQEVSYEKATGTIRTRCSVCKQVGAMFLVGGKDEVVREFEAGP
jgi:hypothetical protein